MSLSKLILPLIIFQCTIALAQTITSTTSGGDWENSSTWIGGIVPNQNNDVIIDGTVSVISGNSSCRNLTVNSGRFLQNGGGFGWLSLHVRGNLVNNGTIRNNPAGNEFNIEVWGNISNNGDMINGTLFIPAQNFQLISQGQGKSFNCSLRLTDAEAYSYTTGGLTAVSDVTLHKNFQLQGYVRNVGDRWGTIDMAGYNLTLQSAARVFYGTVKNTNILKILDDAYIYSVTFEGNTNLQGKGVILNSEVYFNGSLTVTDTLQNGGGLGWLVVHVNGSLTNNGIIKNNYLGNSLHVEVSGNVFNNGTWNNERTFFPAKNIQYISQAAGKFFDTEIRLTDGSGYAFNTGKLIAASDLTFNKPVNMQGWVANVGDYWSSLDMSGYKVALTGNAQMYNGSLLNTNELNILDDACISNLTLAGDIIIKGKGRIDNSTVIFNGDVTVLDTLQNGGGLGWITPVINGNVYNYGYIRNNPAGNELHLDIRGSIYNYGTWNNYKVYLKTEGFDREISGVYQCIMYMNKTGSPASGSVYVKGSFVSKNELRLEDGIHLVIEEGSLFRNEAKLYSNGSVINKGTFYSTHTLEWNDQLNEGLKAGITLVERNTLENVNVSYSYNSFHPLMSSSTKQWWRIKTKGTPGSYKLSVLFDDDLLNGLDPGTLEVFISPDSGNTWTKISNPANTVRDLTTNTITVGTDQSPLSILFGDIILSSSERIPVPSISSAISGRTQIRVGPPNRYTITYWNNSDIPTDRFCFVLNTYSGVHIRSVWSKEIATGNIIEIPVDSLTYDGNKDEVILIVEPLAPKEVRTFDVILTAELDITSKPAELFSFTAAALWIGGAMLEEFISNTIVEGCYEMWRPVSYDESLTDATMSCIKNSVNKAVTVENGVKGVGKKAAEEIIKKTGRVTVWPVMLAKDIFDCLGNTVKGMTDYVNGNFDKQEKSLTKVTSWDPNAKEGPGGFGENGYMSSSAPMLYTIFFENKKEATAPAYEIIIYDTLDENVFDINTVEFREMSHPMGVATRTGNVLKWQFTGIELEPNVTPPLGEGWVKFIVHPKSSLPTGTQLANKAVIKFDLNPWLATNLSVNTLDYDPPLTTARSITRLSGLPGVVVSWDAEDGTGAGIKNSSLYMSVNDGPFTLAAVSDTNFAAAQFKWTKDAVYKFYVISQDNVGNIEQSPANIVEIATGVEVGLHNLPSDFTVEQNYPNPFNPVTKINYSVPEPGKVQVIIYNILGQQAAKLLDEYREAGFYTINWNAANYPSGVYMYKVTYNGKSYVKKMMLLK